MEIRHIGQKEAIPKFDESDIDNALDEFGPKESEKEITLPEIAQMKVDIFRKLNERLKTHPVSFEISENDLSTLLKEIGIEDSNSLVDTVSDPEKLTDFFKKIEISEVIIKKRLFDKSGNIIPDRVTTYFVNALEDKAVQMKGQEKLSA